MYSLLLRKALPFALTFILGSLVGGLFKAVGVGGRGAGHPRAFYYGYGEGHGHSCRMRARQRYLVAESKPLKITFQPDAFNQTTFQEPFTFVPLSVKFGADGTIQGVEQLQPSLPDWMAKEAAKAARQIQFEPETVNGVPVTVTSRVEIRFGTFYD
jgi:hypothetical protein